MSNKSEFIHENSLQSIGIALGIIQERPEPYQIGVASRMRLEIVTDPLPPQEIIAVAGCDIPEALHELTADQWICPKSIVTEGEPPEKAVPIRVLEDSLVARNHHPTVVRWAIYRSVEAGQLLAGRIYISEYVPAYRRPWLPEDVPPGSGEPTTRQIDVTPQNLWGLLVWPTDRLQAAPSSPGTNDGGVVLPVVHIDAQSAAIEWRGTTHPVDHETTTAFQAMIEAKGQPVGLGGTYVRKPSEWYAKLNQDTPELAAIVVRAGNKGHRLTIFDPPPDSA